MHKYKQYRLKSCSFLCFSTFQEQRSLFIEHTEDSQEIHDLLTLKLFCWTKPVHCGCCCAAMHCSPQRRAAAAQLACQGSYHWTAKSLQCSWILWKRLDCGATPMGVLFVHASLLQTLNFSLRLIFFLNVQLYKLRLACFILSISCIKHVWSF